MLLRRCISAALCALAALALAGCGGEESPAAALRARLEDAGTVTISARVEGAAGEDGVYGLTLRRGGAGLSVTVDSPEEIAGVRAEYDEDTLTLEYAGLALPMDTEGLSPITALPETLRALEEGYESLYWTEGGEQCVSLESGDSLTVEARFGPDGELVYAELFSGGAGAVRCEITEFTIE